MLDAANKTEITIIGKYVNNDTGLTFNISNRNVNEISNHHYLWKCLMPFICLIQSPTL